MSLSGSTVMMLGEVKGGQASWWSGLSRLRFVLVKH